MSTQMLENMKALALDIVGHKIVSIVDVPYGDRVRYVGSDNLWHDFDPSTPANILKIVKYFGMKVEHVQRGSGGNLAWEAAIPQLNADGTTLCYTNMAKSYVYENAVIECALNFIENGT